MNSSLLLLDWDDVVMDRAMLRRLQRQKAKELLGEANAGDLWNRYDETKKRAGGKILVDDFIEQCDQEIKALVHEVFYKVDFSQCVDENAWEHLLQESKKAHFDIKIFSEGSQQYQLHKVRSSGLDVPDTMLSLGETEPFFADKKRSFSSYVWSEVHDLGYHKVWFADDRKQYLKAVHAASGREVQCVWVHSREEEDILEGECFMQVENLMELGDLLGNAASGVERSPFSSKEGFRITRERG